MKVTLAALLLAAASSEIQAKTSGPSFRTRRPVLGIYSARFPPTQVCCGTPRDGRWACCVRVLKGHWEHGTQSKTSAKSSKASSTTRMTSVASSRWNSTSEPQSSRDSMKTTGEPQQPSRDTMQPSTDSMEPTVAPQPSDDVMDGMLMR